MYVAETEIREQDLSFLRQHLLRAPSEAPPTQLLCVHDRRSGAHFPCSPRLAPNRNARPCFRVLPQVLAYCERERDAKEMRTVEKREGALREVRKALLIGIYRQQPHWLTVETVMVCPLLKAGNPSGEALTSPRGSEEKAFLQAGKEGWGQGPRRAVFSETPARIMERRWMRYRESRFQEMSLSEATKKASQAEPSCKI